MVKFSAKALWVAYKYGVYKYIYRLRLLLPWRYVVNTHKQMIVNHKEFYRTKEFKTFCYDYVKFAMKDINPTSKYKTLTLKEREAQENRVREIYNDYISQNYWGA